MPVHHYSVLFKQTAKSASLSPRCIYMPSVHSRALSIADLAQHASTPANQIPQTASARRPHLGRHSPPASSRIHCGQCTMHIPSWHPLGCRLVSCALHCDVVAVRNDRSFLWLQLSPPDFRRLTLRSRKRYRSSHSWHVLSRSRYLASDAITPSLSKLYRVPGFRPRASTFIAPGPWPQRPTRPPSIGTSKR